MKYFTPDLYSSLQDFSSDHVMDTAEAAWGQAAERYQRHLKRIQAKLPRGLRNLLQDFYLHDSVLLGMGRQGQTFVITLRLDVPPKELLVLNYHLAVEAVVNTAAFAPKCDSGPVQWMYDEVDLVRAKKRCYRHCILLSNGWEVDLCLRDVRVLRAQTVYPAPGTLFVPGVASGMLQPT